MINEAMSQDRVAIRTHPGEVLREEFLVPLGLSARALATALHVPLNRITGICDEERSVSADSAIRLARYFETSSAFWLNQQQAHDLSAALAARGSEYDGIVARA